MNCDIFKNQEIQNFLSQFESFLRKHLSHFQCLPFKGHQQLKEAIEYSLLSGGKYFRPLLIFATAQLVSIKNKTILPWAGAIEMIHVASLIHDDLPCMDNSSYRRGKASNHRQFGENLALLAGDCLWIEAFRLIYLYGEKNTFKLWLPVLCEATGFNGLMGGQALDLKIPVNPDEYYYKKMHTMKTGALILASMQGVLALKVKETKKTKRIKEAAHLIGQAFQLSDDLQDEKEENASNMVRILGRKKAQDYLHELSDKAFKLIDFEKEKPACDFLKKLIVFNRNRCFLNQKPAPKRN